MSPRTQPGALTHLSRLIQGAVRESRLIGRYNGFAVEAQLARENPAPEMPLAQGGTRQPGRKVDVFKLKLTGVAGCHPWDCRSEPTLLGNLALVLPAGLVFPLIPTRFWFHSSPAEWFAKKVGVPAADAALQDRLRAAGLFDELEALRWGTNPYLPKAAFNPRGQAFGEERFAGFLARLGEEAGDVAREHPGELALEVEGGTPSEERFGQLLDRALCIARINERADTPDIRSGTRRSEPIERRST